MAENTDKDKDKTKGKPWVVAQARRDIKSAQERVKAAQTSVAKKAAQDDLKKAKANLNRLLRTGEKFRDARSDVREARSAVAEAKKTPGKADDRAAQKQLNEAKEQVTSARTRRGRARTKVRDEMYAAMGPMIAEAIREFPALRDFFQQAIAGRWDAKKIQLELNTPDRPWSEWWRAKSEEWRTGFDLQFGPNSTPGTWESKLKQARIAIQAAANKEGVNLSGEDVDKFARRYWYTDWHKDPNALTMFMQRSARRQRDAESSGPNEREPRNPDTSTGKPDRGEQPGSQDGIDLRYADRNKLIDQLSQIAETYGVSLRQARLEEWADRIRNPRRNVDGIEMTRFRELIVQRSRNRYGAFADQITSDMSLADLTQDYVDELVSMLELNEADIRLTPRGMDPLLMQALTNIDKDSGKPARVPLWEFRKQIRADDRWQFTDNARNTYMSAASKFARALGLAG